LCERKNQSASRISLSGEGGGQSIADLSQVIQDAMGKNKLYKKSDSFLWKYCVFWASTIFSWIYYLVIGALVLFFVVLLGMRNTGIVFGGSMLIFVIYYLFFDY
jgi:hypothetical protein